jgi:hypothetical protein
LRHKFFFISIQPLLMAPPNMLADQHFLWFSMAYRAYGWMQAATNIYFIVGGWGLATLSLTLSSANEAARVMKPGDIPRHMPLHLGCFVSQETSVIVLANWKEMSHL